MALEFRILSEHPIKVSGQFLGLGSANPRGCAWTELEQRNRVQVRDGDRYYDVILVDTRGNIAVTDAGIDLVRAKRLFLGLPPDAKWNARADFEDELNRDD
ncbi:hypothetical protein [uncultured Reyranella sp.]|jgi:hypothetical protein|uniref:hypothetical protein n=1 Tax=uncultured Reyranella sp. TaxID=735512 RepID=UPI00259CC5CD|nr:hypothetical protein [uncultured Reyranella sp.]